MADAPDVFFISPVRKLSEKTRKACEEYVAECEKKGERVHWPLRDTKQDAGSLAICTQNNRGIIRATRAALYYDPDSQGSLFDIGMWFMEWKRFKKPIAIVNPEDITATPHKSFANLLLEIHEGNLWRAVRDERLRALHAHTCGRGAVSAGVVKNRHLISLGHNTCRAMRKGGCKRYGMPAGCQQELCGTVHAEVAATLNIRKERSQGDWGRCMMPLWLTQDLLVVTFTQGERSLLEGAELYFSGHHYSCGACREWCRALHITVKGDPLFVQKEERFDCAAR